LPSGSISIRVQACLPEVVALAPPVLATNAPVVVAVVAAVVVVALVVVIVDVLLAVLLDVVDVDVHVLQVTGHCWRKRTGARVVGSGIQMDEVHSLLDMLLQKRGSSTPKHLRAASFRDTASSHTSREHGDCQQWNGCPRTLPSRPKSARLEGMAGSLSFTKDTFARLP